MRNNSVSSMPPTNAHQDFPCRQYAFMKGLSCHPRQAAERTGLDVAVQPQTRHHRRMFNADYVIVGGGSAGCVLASRLTEDPKVSVILLEAGGEDRNPLIHIPAGYIKTMVNPSINWMFETEPEPGDNRKIKQSRAKSLVVPRQSTPCRNCVRLDYDGWAARQSGGAIVMSCPISDRRNIASLLTRMTNLCAWRPSQRGRIAQRIRGARPADQCQSRGYPHNPDYNGATQEGFGQYQVTQKNGFAGPGTPISTRRDGDPIAGRDRRPCHLSSDQRRHEATGHRADMLHHGKDINVTATTR